MDCLKGAVPETERESILLRQIGWMRIMLARTIRVYGRDDKWIKGHLVTLFHALSRGHPLLRRFYKVNGFESATTIRNAEMPETWERKILSELERFPLPQPAGELAENVGLSERNVRKTIEMMNFEGYPIVAVRGGYKVAGTAAELRAYQDKLTEQATSLLVRAGHIGDMAREMEAR